ncbi:hypothetical protein HHI36_024250 [Cryptolaemus montrouzieri]|uniref:Uncharacterized protein n=1 Tax=Cryptolaemus montrouzieri TaxID=559131 RepID=A0ABD2PHV9_9CUCU
MPHRGKMLFNSIFQNKLIKLKSAGKHSSSYMELLKPEFADFVICLNEGKSPIDKRGCHPKANTVPPEVCQKIHEHIFCFPRNKTHYAGKDIDYPVARLDVKTMHSMYSEKYSDLDVK